MCLSHCLHPWTHRRFLALNPQASYNRCSISVLMEHPFVKRSTRAAFLHEFGAALKGSLAASHSPRPVVRDTDQRVPAVSRSQDHPNFSLPDVPQHSGHALKAPITHASKGKRPEGLKPLVSRLSPPRAGRISPVLRAGRAYVPDKPAKQPGARGPLGSSLNPMSVTSVKNSSEWPKRQTAGSLHEANELVRCLLCFVSV